MTRSRVILILFVALRVAAAKVEQARASSRPSFNSDALINVSLTAAPAWWTRDGTPPYNNYTYMHRYLLRLLPALPIGDQGWRAPRLRAGPPRIAVVPYTPFVLPSSWRKLTLEQLSAFSWTSPLPCFVSAGLQLGGVHLPANVSSLEGFDIDVLRTVFEKQLGLPAAWITFPDSLTAYESLRLGLVDVVAGAVEQDPDRAACTPACQSPRGLADDYGGDAERLAAEFATICCLEYSISHVMSGWSLLSLRAPAGEYGLADAILNSDILNIANAVLATTCAAGAVFWVLEGPFHRRVRHLHTCVYWAFVTFATVGYGAVLCRARDFFNHCARSQPVPFDRAALPARGGQAMSCLRAAWGRPSPCFG